jgi:hypothetical protein
MRIRKPRLRISKKGKVSFGGGGLSLGGKHARLNISKSGVSGTVGAGGSSYNTKRGLNCGFIFLLTVAASSAVTVTAVRFLLA